jgi:hypothetical protein
MRRFPVALIPLGLSLALAACGRDQTTSPRSITAGQRSSAVSVTPVAGDACGFDDMKSYARAFFKSGSDPAFKFITDMQAAYGTGGEAGIVAATPYAWKIFKDIATVRLTSAQAGTSTDGANLVIEVANCTTVLTKVTTAGRVAAVPADFTSANLALSLSDGIFEVRGDNATAAPARAYLNSGGRVEAAPIWGVEPKAGTLWPASSPFLIYGYPQDYNATDIATYINTNGPAGSTAYDGFGLSRIPLSQSVSGLLVGICKKALVAAVPATNTPAAVRLLVHSSVNQVNASPSTALCTTITASNTLTGRLMQRLATVLSPAPLFAQDGDTRIGGLPSDWSPNTTGTVTPSDVYLYFSTPQSDGTVNTALDVVVLATEGVANNPAAGTAVSGVVVTLSIAGNNGQPAFFKDGSGNLTSTATAVTDGNGHASFSDYTLTKAGGYTIGASGSVGGLAATKNSLTSTMFNIQNK